MKSLWDDMERKLVVAYELGGGSLYEEISVTHRVQIY
jgi:hypothetical protein